MRRAHLSKYFIQPLKGTVKMYLYPAWSARYILAMIFSSPTLEAESEVGKEKKITLFCNIKYMRSILHPSSFLPKYSRFQQSLSAG